MPRPLASILLALSFLAFANAPVRSEGRRFTLDAQASEARFVVGSTLHKVHGTLWFESGEIRFDTASGVASGEIVVDAARTDTGNAKRDKKMHSEVLQSARYSTFVFEARSIRGRVPDGGGAEIELRGTLIVHGGSHPMTIPVEVEIESGRVEAQASFSVPYVEWGLSDPSGFLLRVAKIVEVTLEIRGSLDSTSPGPPDLP